MLVYLEDYTKKIVFANGIFTFEIDNSDFDVCGSILNQQILVGTTSGTDIKLDVTKVTFEAEEEIDEVTHYEIHMNVRMALGDSEEIDGESPVTCAYWMLSDLNMDCEFLELEFKKQTHCFKVLSSNITWIN
ncbi:hypothetical protein EEL30_21845 [Brevibacillus laterosporus]|uniref:Uncharacterized protein n=1 Tax=Brevibacillus laterosporus TaxID=1465 RepID=A0A518VCG3_BRELA|nr:hypothetical protein EEL30_21845 [Brevibacillus laterosporus]